MRRSILFASFVMILPVVVQAQGRAVMAGGSHPMAAAPSAGVHVAPTQAMPVARVVMGTSASNLRKTRSALRITKRPTGTQRRIEDDEAASASDFVPVPGLGFDMTHLAATRGAAAVGASRHKQSVPLFFPFLESGFFLPGAAIVAEEGAAPESQPAEDAEAEGPRSPRRVRVTESARTPEVETVTATLRQAEEFVFVRRDGTVFFAVAYAWEKGTLRYVTSEGLRRSLPRDALDLDATHQFNEQRGMNFRSPA